MKELNAKRILFAAGSSNSGKTMITCAMLEVLKRRGAEPVSFKCGPDYIDPMFHKKVLGIDSRNLDTYFSGKEGVKRIMAGCGDRYAVAEGVMGIYDGTRADDISGSCYEIAEVTSTPVILIVNASGIGRTVISLIKGILLDDTEGLIKGIILNNISESFYSDLKPVLEKEISKMRDDVLLLGSFPKKKEIAIESRHLGLKLPGEIEDIRIRISEAASILEKNVDIDKLVSIMENAESIELTETDEDNEKNGEGLTLAVAYDEAFCFYYRENLDMFEKRGVKLSFFSPVKDSCIPKDADGILLGGGYPENHLEELSGNRDMLSSVREVIEAGIPSLAECGGFMYLHKTIRCADGKEYGMAGVIDGECEYTGHLVRFGYMEIEALADPGKDVDEAEEVLVGMKGHEFHYFDSSRNGETFVAKKPYKSVKWNCIVSGNNGIWGFPHFYYASKPEFVDAFIKRMRERTGG